MTSITYWIRIPLDWILYRHYVWCETHPYFLVTLSLQEIQTGTCCSSYCTLLIVSFRLLLLMVWYFLKHLISEHHQLFKLVYPQKRLIPKHYFMVHYPLCIRKIGPLLHFWSMRFEENKLFKNMLKSFKNITKSLVKKTSNGNRKSLGNAQFTAERIWTNELFLSVTMKMVKTWQMLCKSHYRQTFTQLD